MAKSDELVKYVTQRVVQYIEMPKEVRKQVRATQREGREHWETRWFGMLPLALRMWTKPLRHRLARDKQDE
ncbi:YqzE family protein [Paenibacillus silviterrae]|uniref:YqzE family protein n=1 Tax=Paenibacillus silviterrae TaxID=3242194 RepID=UPI0025426BD7|nr:YqzE family protein [Paenibacillus chinjuensis]